MAKYNEPRLCDFNRISLSVPRFKLIKLLLKRRHLQGEEVIFLKTLQYQIEVKENQILHVKSIIEKALLKAK
jgi:hypothetical protein